MIDVCVHTYCRRDVECLDVFLYSLERFAGLAFCNILLSCGSSDPIVRKLLTEVCDSRPARSLNIDFFDPVETLDSNQHGEGLNRLFARTTSKYVVVADPDVMVVSPDWLGFCRRHIDLGCFIVGAPYEMPGEHWQGRFPTVWLDMLDGDELRSANLDMRTKHIHFDARANRWRLSGRKSRDMGWELAKHAFENELDWISLTLARDRRMASDMRSQGGFAPVSLQRARRRAGKWLQELNAIEFLYPETDELCCAHLINGGLHGIGTPRTDKWTACAKMVVDMYAEN